jgi:hypothetical protein
MMPLRVMLDRGPPAFVPNAAFFAGAAGLSLDLSDKSTLYTDSARTTLVTTAGDLIGSPSDLSGNGKHPTQATSGARPAWQTTYAALDGVNDCWATPSINFTGTDKITVIVSLYVNNTTSDMVMELSSNLAAYAGAFYFVTGNDSGFTQSYISNSNGTNVPRGAGVARSLSQFDVFSGIHDIAGSISTAVLDRVAGTSSTASKGTGNFGNYPLYIGSRAGSTLYFSGRISRLIVIGRKLTAPEIAAAEAWCAAPVGVVLP